MEQAEEARLAQLRQAWVEGQGSGPAVKADFAAIKAEGRVLLDKAAK